MQISTMLIGLPIFSWQGPELYFIIKIRMPKFMNLKIYYLKFLSDIEYFDWIFLL